MASLEAGLPGINIDFNSPVPYYYQVKEWVSSNIARGNLKPGEQLPSEAQLCQAFGVSRTVVRQALEDLVNQGLVYRQKGKGTFVARPKIREGLAQKLTGFYQDMVERGLKPVTKVLELKVIPASGPLAEHLRLKPGAEVINIVRLRYVNDEPIVYVTTYIPYASCPGLLTQDLSNVSLYALLEQKYGLEVARGKRTLEAIAATEQDARLLGIKPGDPIFLLQSTSYLGNGQPIEYYVAKHRGDRSQFEVELIRVRGENAPLSDPAVASELPRSNSLRSP